MKVKIEKDSSHYVAFVEGPRGTEYLRDDATFKRSDGVVFVSGNLNAGPLFSDLTPEQRAMAEALFNHHLIK